MYAKYNGLLRILELRLSDIQKAHEENENLKANIQKKQFQFNNQADDISILLRKIKELKTKKRAKVTLVILK